MEVQQTGDLFISKSKFQNSFVFAKLNNNISKNTEIKFVGQPNLRLDLQRGSFD